ncbi:nucleotide pyrophosphohydrolase [Enterococcus dongliensis]|uniref:Nucleotide pyrophosphohydrolase n=2 Tax=Enterococcus dongliensis TaxID=2559925 RepID=A0AAW8TIQ7_9ENTE|nr:nucleotide pyrophosphohydrolase [Enterococcus dongliensis]MDT2596738.1 nucleotide pyrophosphohydrolase [Enterococcus dongliensis]MDT2604579.1 nucleotide pyrophosphohydrolase [Enterococcus dongliensis]MDT2635133.1 nucleotide pyrophosphohydrolase [Enterococcus dongliensis]MDT2636572.1 nucleotide pyrophosphohydrolase [Enterococcus dongliensis]MDT2640750.1 nucleotide pyrophosphohydrolase [Enterococcus dongliensis]
MDERGGTMDSMEKINQFRDERNWRQFHNEKDLALSICLEAAELLELFQWKDSAEARTQTERLKEELADVLIYSYMMADNLDFDIDEIISEKLKKNAIKYPVEK